MPLWFSASVLCSPKTPKCFKSSRPKPRCSDAHSTAWSLCAVSADDTNCKAWGTLGTMTVCLGRGGTISAGPKQIPHTCQQARELLHFLCSVNKIELHALSAHTGGIFLKASSLHLIWQISAWVSACQEPPNLCLGTLASVSLPLQMLPLGFVEFALEDIAPASFSSNSYTSPLRAHMWAGITEKLQQSALRSEAGQKEEVWANQ